MKAIAGLLFSALFIALSQETSAYNHGNIGMGGPTFSESRAQMTCEAVTSDRQFRCGHDANGKQFLIDEEYIYIGYEKVIHTQRSYDFETGRFINEKSYLQDMTNPYAKPHYK